MTGRETLEFVLSLDAEAGPADRGWIDAALARVGLADAADRRTKTYSGGMRQRLGIAQALVTRPRVVLDEPVSALDPIGRREVLDLMADLKGEATVFYSTHILDDVQRVSDHVAILDRGRLTGRPPRPTCSRASPRTACRSPSAGRGRRHPARRHPGRHRRRAGRPGRRHPSLHNPHPPRRCRGRPACRDPARADRDLTVIENDLVRLDLEDVFLRLIDQKERAA